MIVDEEERNTKEIQETYYEVSISLLCVCGGIKSPLITSWHTHVQHHGLSDES